jgi:phage regulator Rha-like protein
MTNVPAVDSIEDAIHVIRGRRVMLDADLARLYGVRTERLTEQVRRNAARFPVDFVFRLTRDEWQEMCPQIAGTLRRTRRADYLPFAFTEHGCLMAANVLRSGRAVEVSVLVVRAFVRMRSALAANAELAATVDKLARQIEDHGGKLAVHEEALQNLLAEIRLLTQFPEAPRRGIGFTAEWPRDD